MRTTDVLADLDVARWRPEVADELMALRRHADFTFPTAMAPRAVRLAALATRCRTIVELALEDDGGSVSASRGGGPPPGPGPARPRCETRSGGGLLVPLGPIASAATWTTTPRRPS